MIRLQICGDIPSYKLNNKIQVLFCLINDLPYLPNIVLTIATAIFTHISLPVMSCLVLPPAAVSAFINQKTLENMKDKIKVLGLCIVRFGLMDGAKLYYNLLPGHAPKLKVPSLKHPIVMRRNTSDPNVFRQVFLKNEYDIKIPFNPSVIIDGGANIGLFSIKMKNEFPESTIICIEPDPDNFKSLSENVSVYPNVHCENSGIWSKSVTLKVYDKYHSGKWGMVTEEDPAGNISALSIGYIMEKYKLSRIDILKLDIESSEKIVFSEYYKDWLPKVKMIIVELHDFMQPGCAKAFFDAINASFSSYTYSVSGENTIIINNDLP